MVHVRAFAPEDEDGVARMWSEVFPDDPPRNEPRAMIARKLDRDRELFWVAIDDGEVVGAVVAGYVGVRGWLYHLGVARAHRKRGIATALVDQAVESLRALGCIKVNLQVRRGNEGVLGFYESLGWVADPAMSMGRLLKEV